MKYPFTYVVIYSDYDENSRNNKYLREAGLGFADNYTEATHMLEDAFGEDLIRIVNLFLLGCGDLLQLPEEYITRIENDTAIKPVECDAYGNPIPTTNTEKYREELKKFKQAVNNSQMGKPND